MAKRIVVLASGGGTNFQAIVDATRRGELPVTISLLICDRPGAGALRRGEDASIPSVVIDRNKYGPDLSDHILEAIPPGTDLIVLAGFLSILRGRILRGYRNRIINLHPALLPRHGGPGMYGIHVHRAVLAAGDTETGCTVHYVDEGTDTGPTILQRRIPVAPSQTPESLATRLSEVEHVAIVEGIRKALSLTPDRDGDE